MKTKRCRSRSFPLIGSLLSLVALSILFSSSLYAADTYYVQVRSVALRAQPKSFAKPLGSLRYQDSVEKLSEEGGWVQVRAQGRTGFLHESALTTTRIVSKTDTLSPFAGESDVVLAGKGFSPEVEREYLKQNPSSRSTFGVLDGLERSYERWDPGLVGFRSSGKLQERTERGEG